MAGVNRFLLCFDPGKEKKRNFFSVKYRRPFSLTASIEKWSDGYLRPRCTWFFLARARGTGSFVRDRLRNIWKFLNI